MAAVLTNKVQTTNFSVGGAGMNAAYPIAEGWEGVLDIKAWNPFHLGTFRESFF